MALDLLGSTLLTQDGPKPASEVLAGKVVGLYFSAHWCPPCRGFTPTLAAAYSADLKGKGLEVVFISSDRDEASFDEYFATMPWAALPYQDRDAKAALSKQFKVSGIPTLVLVGADGATITTDAKGDVEADPQGAKFPWRPPALRDLLDTDLVGKEGPATMASLEGKVVGLYFSAHWCPPCRGFTPQLVAKYKELTGQGLPLEIVFVSSDRDADAAAAYHGDMPWLMLPYSDRDRKESLSKHFGVSGVPTLVLLDKDRSVITSKGRSAIMGDAAEFPFYPQPVQPLSDPDGIDETASVILFCEAQPRAEQDALCAALEPMARAVQEAAKASGADPEFLFFAARSGAGPVGQIRSMCQLPTAILPHEHELERIDPPGGGWGCDGCNRGGRECSERHRCSQGCDHDYCEVCVKKAAEEQAPLPASLVLLDIPDNGGYYTPAVPLTADGVKQLVADYRSKKLDRKQLEG